MISYFVGDRGGESALILADDLRSGIASDRIQSTTDVRVHKTLLISPAMAAGVSKTLWTMDDIAARVEARRPEAALRKRGPRGSYKAGRQKA